MCQIQNSVTQQHHQLFMLTIEQPGQRLFTCLADYAFPHPLPELSLCGPELFPVFADHERRFLLAFLFLVRVSAQFDTPRPFARQCKTVTHRYPVGKPLLRGGNELSKTADRIPVPANYEQSA